MTPHVGRLKKEPSYADVVNDRFSLRSTAENIAGRVDASVSMVTGNGEAKAVSAPMPYDDAFVFFVRLEHGTPYQLWIDGKFKLSGRLRSGSSSIFDLRTSPYAVGIKPFQHMHFYFSKACLQAAIDGVGDQPYPEIILPHDFAFRDPVMLSIACALTPAFRNKKYTSSLFVDHLVTAAASHFVTRYGQPRQPSQAPVADSSPAQLSLAKEMMDSKSDGNLTVHELADASGLRHNEFNTLFHRQTGMTPPAWLVRRRTEKALDLLRRTTKSLDEVASLSGFLNAHHMVQSFMMNLGNSPEVFRRDAALVSIVRN